MSDSISGSILTQDEMKMRGIFLVPTDRGGVEFRTKASYNTIAMILIKEGFIEDFHYTDATIFMDLRRAYETSIGIKWGHVRIELEDLGLTAGEASERYDAIRHTMGIKKAASITKFILVAMLEQYTPIRAEAKVVYKDAFELLTKTMMEVKKNFESSVA